MRGKGVLLGLLALAACDRPTQPAPSGKRPLPRVTTAVAAVREIEYVLEATGSLEASEEVSIAAGVEGRVDAVHFKEGDAVGPETVLAEIDVEKYRLAEERARAELERAQAHADLAATLYANRVRLQEEGRKQKREFVTEEQMATWKADLEKAKADAARAQADLALAARDHRNARVRSPIEGLINAKGVSRGEFVRPETVVAAILKVRPLHLRFTVAELEASRLVPGQDVRFRIRSAPGRDFRARLFWLNQKADPVTRMIEAKAEVVEPDGLLRAGTFAEVRITTGRQPGLVVPERAVLPTERGFVVFVLEGRTARLRPVRLGLRLPGHVEVVEGLRPEDRLVLDGAAVLEDGKEVEIVEEGPRPVPGAATGS